MSGNQEAGGNVAGSSGSWNPEAFKKHLFPPIPQIWKNETLAEQNKLSPTEKPVLLSKDVELKIAALDREVQYLLNKAKFAKPKPKKEKNTTKTDSGKNATATSETENTIPPTEGKQEGKKQVGSVCINPSISLLCVTHSSLSALSDRELNM